MLSVDVVIVIEECFSTLSSPSEQEAVLQHPSMAIAR